MKKTIVNQYDNKEDLIKRLMVLIDGIQNSTLLDCETRSDIGIVDSLSKGDGIKKFHSGINKYTVEVELQEKI